MGPLVITPKIPIPRAHRWFYEKFRFASNADELKGGPNFGLRIPPPKPEKGSYAVMYAMMPSSPKEPKADRKESAEVKQAAAKTSRDPDAGREAEENTQNPSTPSPFRTTPKPRGEI